MSIPLKASTSFLKLLNHQNTLVFLLLLVALILTAYTKSNPAIADKTNSFFLGVASPVVKVLGAVESQIGSFFSDYFFLLNVKEQNKQFQEKMSHLVAENTKLQEVRYQNERLEKILNFTKQTSFQGKVVRVVAYANPLDSHSVIIDRGSQDGIQLQSAVVDGQALVGLVTQVGRSAATVTLISDPSIAVDAMIQNGRMRGLVKGQGSDLRWTYLSSDQQIYLGNRVITSGFDQLYPVGLVIGNITKVSGEKNLIPEIRLQPIVDLEKLETLFVINPDSQQKSKNE